MLLVTVMVVLLSIAEGDRFPVQKIAYSDILKVFSQIARPYDERKVLRNQKIDMEVQFITDKIFNIMPGLEDIHVYANNLSSGVPDLKSKIFDPLVRAKNNMKQVNAKLNICTPRRTPYTPGPDTEADTSSEQDKLHPPNVLIEDNRLQEASPTRSNLGELRAPVKVLDSTIYAILSNYESNSVVAVRDATLAFRAVADKISQEHWLRFIGLIPKVETVKENVDTIIKHVNNEKLLLAGASRNAFSFFEKSATITSVLTNLTSRALNLARDIC